MTEQPQELPLVYGVWIVGQGWLRDRHSNIFADMRKQLAADAKAMYRGEAYVVLIDESMIALEPLFLEREKLAIRQGKKEQTERNREAEEARLINRLKRWANGLLGHRNNK